MQAQRMLLVGPPQASVAIDAECALYTLEYRYVDAAPDDGFAAWRTESGESVEKIDVLRDCEAFSGGYTRHALNRFFGQALLRHKPSVVVIIGLSGATADLPRVASLLGVPVVLQLDRPGEDLALLDAATVNWLRASLDDCDRVLPGTAAKDDWPATWLAGLDLTGGVGLAEAATGLDRGAPDYRYDYAIHEFCQRDHPLLVAMQAGEARHFSGCRQVLDLACGVGIFLDCLRREGIAGAGVERDPRIARYARGMGLDVVTEDALAYLESGAGDFDAVHCSHFIEHLPAEAVTGLLELLFERLPAGGVLVLVFPDPESIRSQLLGFWRDPEHVRFYHPELVAAMATASGFELEFSSYDEQPHRVVPFAEDPPALPSLAVTATAAEAAAVGPFERLLGLFGLASTGRRVGQLEQRLERLTAGMLRQAEASRALEARTDVLWDINRTWAWNDNATLRLRKPADSV
ncbi:MAG: class I SAM-dependent methyltransferase [Halioglobus sp.]|nr:class I SAM-dependent methyltransferase [Halioglobus sp.]